MSWPVDDALDVPLHDDPLAEEVDLVTRLMVVCNERGRRLTQCEIDEALGLPRRVRPAPRVSRPESASAIT